VPDADKPKLLDQIREACRVRHYSIRTEDAYADWAKRFILFHGKRHPLEMGVAEINRFLTHLAVEGNVSASTQNQAFSAVLFLYLKVLEVEPGRVTGVIRAKRPVRLPVVLSKPEVQAVLGRLRETPRLVGYLLYGSGLRVLEALRLRVHDLDFVTGQILVRAGKGNKDRRVMLPRVVTDPLLAHLDDVKARHAADLADGCGEVYLPEALARKYPKAPREWGWQYVFPARARSTDPRSGAVRRHHLSEQAVQKAVKAAAHGAGLVKAVSPHTFRHSFATHLLEAGYDIRTIQELMGHASVETTMIYLHVLNKGGKGVESPADSL